MGIGVASSIMPRTTLDLDPSVLRQLKKRGQREGKSMGELASEILAVGLAGRLDEGVETSSSFEWVSRDLGTPLVDLEDKDAVWRILDGQD